MDWKGIRKIIIEKYQENNGVEVHELIWITRTIRPGMKIDWSHVDTVDYDIESIPKKKELIIEFNAKQTEVEEKCRNLLR